MLLFPNVKTVIIMDRNALAGSTGGKEVQYQAPTTLHLERHCFSSKMRAEYCTLQRAERTGPRVSRRREDHDSKPTSVSSYTIVFIHLQGFTVIVFSFLGSHTGH